MSWTFDEDVVLNVFADQIEAMIGDRLGVLKDPDGVDTTVPAIIISEENGRQASLPFIVLDFIPTTDSNGHTLDSGILVEEDPDNVGESIYTPYYDSAINFGISLRCEGEGSQKILREIRNRFKLEEYRHPMRILAYTSIELINPILKTPDLLANSYRQVHTMLINMNSVDRMLDPTTGYFDTVDWGGTLSRGVEDPTPILLTGSATSKQP